MKKENILQAHGHPSQDHLQFVYNLQFLCSCKRANVQASITCLPLATPSILVYAN